MSQEERIYVGSGKKASQYDIVNVSICIDDLEKHIFEYKGKRYAKLTVAAKKETDQYGKTHSVSINTWKPDENATKNNSTVANNATPAPELQGSSSDLPF